VAVGGAATLYRQHVCDILHLAILLRRAGQLRQSQRGNAGGGGLGRGRGAVNCIGPKTRYRNQALDTVAQIAVAIVVPLISLAGAAYATRSQLRQAEISRAAEDKKSDNAHALDLERFKREVEAKLWEKVKEEIATERAARLTLATELEAERAARRELAQRVEELTAENARLRMDNAALMAAIEGKKRL